MLLVDLLRDVFTEILSGDLFMRKAFGKGLMRRIFLYGSGEVLQDGFSSRSFYAGAGTRRRADLGVAGADAYVPGETVGARV